MTKPIVKFMKVNPEATLPQYQTEAAAGMDLITTEDELMCPGDKWIFDTGLAVEIPPGYEGQIRSRSGLAAKNGIAVLNSPGTIDSDYRGEIKVILVNHSRHDYVVHAGDRIAQLVIAPVSKAVIEEAFFLSDSGRGAGGLGSTGVK